MRHFHLPSLALAAATLTMASPAFAQDLCGFTDGQWIGGDEAGSDIATAEAYQEQMALVLGGNSYVSLFTLSDTTDVRVEAQGRGAGDPLFDLMDSTGTLILSDDDSGGGGAARAETQLSAGTYCVAVKSYDGAPLTAFVRVGRSEQEALTTGASVSVESAGSGTPTGSCEEAQPLEGTLPEGLRGTAAVSENGFWSFTLTEELPVSITATNSDADPVLKLLQADGTYIAENDDSDGLNSRIDQIAGLAAGDYCLEVSDLNDGSLPITVEVTEFDPVAAALALYARGEVAPPLDGTVPFTELGVLQNRLRQDFLTTGDVTWFTVEMPEAGLLLAEAFAVGDGDPWMVAYDDLGRNIAQNDDYGENLDSLIAVRVTAGTYLIGVRQLDEGQSGNVRLIFERFAAAQ